MASGDPRDQQFGQPFAGTADKQTVTITGSPTGGTFTLTFKGQATAGIAYNAAAAAVQSALLTLSTIGNGNVTVSGSAPGGPYVVTFTGTLSGYQSDLSGNAASLTGGTNPSVTVAHTQLGAPVQQAARGGTQTVLDMYSLKSVTITTSASDNHYTTSGRLYHE
jgi:hypothetical protein